MSPLRYTCKALGRSSSVQFHIFFLPPKQKKMELDFFIRPPVLSSRLFIYLFLLAKIELYGTLRIMIFYIVPVRLRKYDEVRYRQLVTFH